MFTHEKKIVILFLVIHFIAFFHLWMGEIQEKRTFSGDSFLLLQELDFTHEKKKKLKSNLKNFTNEKNRKRKCHVIVWKKYLDQQLTSDSENVFLTLLRNLFFLLRMFFFSFQKNFLIKQKQNLVSCVTNNKKYFKKQIVTQFHTGSLVFFHISVFKTFHIFFSPFHSVSHKKSLKMTMWMFFSPVNVSLPKCHLNKFNHLWNVCLFIFHFVMRRVKIHFMHEN